MQYKLTLSIFTIHYNLQILNHIKNTLPIVYTEQKKKKKLKYISSLFKWKIN